jgi:hypothetical protein
MSTEATTNPLLTEGRGVVFRDTEGIGEPILGRIVKISDGYALATILSGHSVRFELSTGWAMSPGNHERWKATAPRTPSSDEYDSLRTQQARLEAELAAAQRRLDIVTAVLEAADDMAVEPYTGPGKSA